MITTKTKSPKLEIVTPQYETLIRSIYQNISHLRLCWLVEEELEFKYPNSAVNKELYFNKKGDVIRFQLRKSRKIVAKIRF